MGSKRGRRLLFFAYYYPPLGGAGSLRALSFARHLPALGWDVTVVTPRDGVYGRDPSLGDGTLPGVEVLRTGSLEPGVLLRRLRRGGGASRERGAFVEEAELGLLGRSVRAAARRWLYFPDANRGWVGTAVREALRLHARSPVAAVLSSSPPVSAHLAARDFARRTGVPWIADWRDPWTAHMEGEGRRRTRARQVETALLREAHRVTCATEGLGRILDHLGGGALRPVTIRNGFDPEDFAGPAPPAPVGPPFVLHAGTLYGRDQDLSTFLDAFARHREGAEEPRPTLRFLGKLDPHTLGLIRDRGLGDATGVEGFATHRDTVAAMRSASLLLLLTWSRDSELGRAICPAKMYEYLAAGRPILALGQPGSEALEMLEGMPGVSRARFDDEAAILRGLEAGLRSTPGGAGGTPASLAAFTRARQAALLSSTIGDALDGRPSP